MSNISEVGSLRFAAKQSGQNKKAKLNNAILLVFATKDFFMNS